MDFNLGDCYCLSFDLMGKQKAWFRCILIWGSYLAPFLKQGWWSTGNANNIVISLSIQAINIPGAAIFLLWIVFMDPSIIPFAWDLAPFSYYWSLALDVLGASRNHYDKVVAYEAAHEKRRLHKPDKVTKPKTTKQQQHWVQTS